MSAVGGQFADLFTSAARSLQTISTAPDRAAIARALDEIDAAAEAFFARVTPHGERRRELVCEARYANQLWEIDLLLPADWRGQAPEDWRELALRFDRLHRSLFSVAEPGAPIEILGLRGEARVTRPRPRLATRAMPAPASSTASHRSSAPPTRHRAVRFAGEPAAREWVPVYRGGTLPTGTRIEGPAILEEETTTIVLDPGAVATAAPAHYSIELAPMSRAGADA